jgi:alpha-galactosidase
VWVEGPYEIWAKPLGGGAKAVGLFNRADTPREMSLQLSTVGFGNEAKLRDLWAEKDVTTKDGVYTVLIPAHGAVMLKVDR